MDEVHITEGILTVIAAAWGWFQRRKRKQAKAEAEQAKAEAERTKRELEAIRRQAGTDRS
jgi:type VI protein secretion system component VasK